MDLFTYHSFVDSVHLGTVSCMKYSYLPIEKFVTLIDFCFALAQHSSIVTARYLISMIQKLSLYNKEAKSKYMPSASYLSTSPLSDRSDATSSQHYNTENISSLYFRLSQHIL